MEQVIPLHFSQILSPVEPPSTTNSKSLHSKEHHLRNPMRETIVENKTGQMRDIETSPHAPLRERERERESSSPKKKKINLSLIIRILH
jgi:hypothetical protein